MLDASTPDIAGIFIFIIISDITVQSNLISICIFWNTGEQNFTLSKDKSVIVDNNKFSWPVDDILQSRNVNGKYYHKYLQ